ncbi:PREDICTED: uncharacterized protein LOC106902265 [Calidris pugnax]|uniref:uncharacterized protein LOC106902265 n=1 Tax=Calidris pugnax TaxID=198806 RepID=UPI00071C32C3|nr:PREDICTED: uncharacterized protein LOC106902265 [Calidris pugnax]
MLQDQINVFPNRSIRNSLYSSKKAASGQENAGGVSYIQSRPNCIQFSSLHPIHSSCTCRQDFSSPVSRCCPVPMAWLTHHTLGITMSQELREEGTLEGRVETKALCFISRDLRVTALLLRYSLGSSIFIRCAKPPDFADPCGVVFLEMTQANATCSPSQPPAWQQDAGISPLPEVFSVLLALFLQHNLRDTHLIPKAPDRAGTVLTIRKQLHPVQRGQDHALTGNRPQSPSKKGHFQHQCERGWKRKQ